MKIAVTGSTGLIGSRFAELFKGKYDIVHLNLSQGVNITDKDTVSDVLSEERPALILHLAAKTNVDDCEEDRNFDLEKLKKEGIYTHGEIDLSNLRTQEWKNENSAFAINVVGTRNISNWAKENQVKIIYTSTDFVFDGNKNNSYTENDIPNPINWYGLTKFWGEKTLDEKDLIARISYPFGYKSKIKKDFIWMIAELLQTKDSVRLISDHIITPTFIDDIVRGVDFLILRKEIGIINLVGNDSLSPYQIGITIAEEFGLDRSKIDATTREEFYSGRAPRPFKLELENDKLKNLGHRMTDFVEVLRQIKEDL